MHTAKICFTFNLLCKQRFQFSKWQQSYQQLPDVKEKELPVL